MKYTINLRSIKCITKINEGSASEEPYLLALLCQVSLQVAEEWFSSTKHTKRTRKNPAIRQLFSCCFVCFVDSPGLLADNSGNLAPPFLR